MATIQYIDDLAAAARACLAWTHADPNAAAVLQTAGRMLAADPLAKLEQIAADELADEGSRTRATAHLSELCRTAELGRAGRMTSFL